MRTSPTAALCPRRFQGPRRSCRVTGAGPAHSAAGQASCEPNRVLRSVAERAYGALEVAAVDDTRYAPSPVGVDGAPEDAQLADSQPPPGLAALQCAVVGVGGQRLAGERVSHSAQSSPVVVWVQLA